MKLFLAALVTVLALVSPANAQNADPSPPAAAASAGSSSPEEQQKLQDAMIKASQNPVGNLGIFPVLSSFNYGYGPYSRLQYYINVQPVVPIQLNPSLNLISRTIVPLVNNPSSAPPAVCASAAGCPGTFGLGDITQQFYFAPKTSGGIIWGAGAQMLFPSASQASLGAGKYGVGPTLVGLIMPGNIVTGVLLTQMNSVGGDPTRPKISVGVIQPFFNYNLPQAWSVSVGSPGIVANWLATPQQGMWLVPIGPGVTKTFKLGGQPMNIELDYYGNVVKPANAPNYTIRFVWRLLFPIKRGQALP